MDGAIQRLFTPGPVPVPDNVVHACAAQPLYHRSAAFKETSIRVWNALARVYRTQAPVLVLAGSAMTGIEAAVASLHTPGDQVLVLNNGRFAERCSTILERYGCTVDEIVVEWGETITAEQVIATLTSMPTPDAVWITHSETSTGVTLDLRVIASAIRECAPHALVCVDAVTSMAVHPVETDAWDLDVVITGIQKGLCCPPGLACVSLSERAQRRLGTLSPRAYTLELSTVLKHYHEHLFAWTPPVTLVAGLDVALTSILDVGMEATWQKHQQVADHLRTRLRTMGLTLFGKSTSNAVTAVEHPHADHFRRRLWEQHQIVVAGGQDRLAGRILRIGTCGPYTIHDIDLLCTALEDVLASQPVL